VLTGLKAIYWQLQKTRRAVSWKQDAILEERKEMYLLQAFCAGEIK
jgi:hypothetical protein